VHGESADDDLSIPLYRDSRRAHAGTEVVDLAAVAEACVEAAVGFVAGKRNATPAESHGDDLPVALERQRGCPIEIAAPAEISRQRPAVAEPCVEAAIAVVAGKREISAAQAGARFARDDDLA